ncbi:MAG: carboxynorspermidine decarboxylase [Bacteroidota bacterium]
MAIDFNKIPSPCYVLDQESLRINLEILNMVQKEADVKIICALKGFAMWSTFPMVREYLSGAAASSLNEAQLVLDEMGCTAHTYAPVYLDHEFEELLGYSSHITFNSLSQWEKFRDRVKLFTRPITCGLRINPEYSEVETELYNPAVAGSRLGIRPAQMPEKLPEGIEGLHFHVLCENDSFVLERTLQKVEEKFSHLIKQAKWLNMGGGHHITRKGYDVEHLVKMLKEFKNRYPNLEEVILEPGEAIGWQTGYLTSTVQDIVESEGIKVAMLDVSFTCHMPDCLEMPYKPTILNATDAVPGKPTYRMGGMSCLAGDYMGMGDYSFDNELKPGDPIIFDDMIHYTMVKTSTFNGVNLPAIGIWTESDEFILLKYFGYEDYRNRLS